MDIRQLLYSGISLSLSLLACVPLCLDHRALCRFLRGKHRLTKVTLQQIPEQLIVAALSTESSTMEELVCYYSVPVYIGQLCLSLYRGDHVSFTNTCNCEEHFPSEVYNCIFKFVWFWNLCRKSQ